MSSLKKLETARDAAQVKLFKLQEESRISAADASALLREQKRQSERDFDQRIAEAESAEQAKSKDSIDAARAELAATEKALLEGGLNEALTKTVDGHIVGAIFEKWDMSSGWGGNKPQPMHRSRRGERAVLEAWGPESTGRVRGYGSSGCPGEIVLRELKKDGTPAIYYHTCRASSFSSDKAPHIPLGWYPEGYELKDRKP